MDIATLEKWIEQGRKPARPEPAFLEPGHRITPQEQSHWTFWPIVKSEVPQVKDAHRVPNEIDSFLLFKMPEKNLTYPKNADRQTLILRAYVDFIGLPPTREQIVVFLNDPPPDAYELLTAHLLDSPHYGKRWGRHWLDIAECVASEGYTNEDPVHPDAYKYRDYVIAALNNDLPFDQFLQEQLAGNEIVQPPFKEMPAEDQRKLTATGLLRMAIDGTVVGENTAEMQNKVNADTIRIQSSSLLGISLGRAQCHDLQYDPISQEDYYYVRAVFNWKNWRVPSQRRLSLYTQQQRSERAKVAQKIDA